MSREWHHLFQTGVLATIWIETKLFPCFFLTFPAVSFIVLYHRPVGMLAHSAADLWGEKGRTPLFLSMPSACSPAVMIFCGGLLGRKTCDWKITVILLFCFVHFPAFFPSCISSRSAFPQVPVLRLADRRIVCLPREINYSLFFVNSFQNQMLVHHILVIKQITSGAAEHRHKLCLVLPPNLR